MRLSDVGYPTTVTHNSDVDEIFEHYNSFIRALARKKIPHAIISADVIDLDINELAQISRLKLWLALQIQDIRNTNAYIRRVVHKEAI